MRCKACMQIAWLYVKNFKWEKLTYETEVKIMITIIRVNNFPSFLHLPVPYIGHVLHNNSFIDTH